MKSIDVKDIITNKSAEVVKTYRIFFCITAIGVTLALLMSSKPYSEKMISMLLMLAVLSANFWIVKTAEHRQFSTKNINIIMLITMVLLYFIAVYVSIEHTVWTPVNWFASFFIVIFSMFKKRLLMVYLIFHSVFVIALFLISPTNTIVFENGHLISILSNVIVLGVIAYKYTGIFENFENSLLSQINMISDKNDELQALNEEYFAAQEELFQQYDTINSLLIEKELINEQFLTVIDATEEMIIDYNVQEKTYKISRNLSNLFPELGVDTVELTGLLNRLDSDDSKQILTEFEAVKTSIKEYYVQTVKYVDANNVIAYYNIGLIGFTSKINQNRHVIITINDVSMQKKSELQIYQMAYYDDLTELYNRRGFEKAIEEYLRSDIPEPFNFILLNISEFHLINSVLGYDIGDEVLQLMAKRINECITSRINPCRLSADNYVFIASPDINLKALKSILEEPLVMREMKVAIRITLGITQYPKYASSYLELIRQAELALASAKKLPNATYYLYNENLISNYERRLQLINMMRHSILTDEFTAYFQPIIDVQENKLIGFEALARWHSKQEGFVSPAEFIPLAEQIGHIHNLGKLILRNTCVLILNLGNKKHELTVSVNLSSVQFLSNHLASELISIVDDYMIPHRCIAFEITESVLIENFEMAMKQLNILRNSGFKIYLDDFGTGYSSLSYLSTLPIDVMKLDRSFTSEATLDERKYNFLVAIVQMANVLNLEIIAEGIETQTQLSRVNNAGINAIQGYFFSKPIAENEALVFVEKFNKTN